MTTTTAAHPRHTAVTKDPICGMVVDPKTAPHAEHEGKTSYFCGAACRSTFVDQHSSKTPQATAGGMRKAKTEHGPTAKTGTGDKRKTRTPAAHGAMSGNDDDAPR